MPVLEPLSQAATMQTCYCGISLPALGNKLEQLSKRS